MPANFRLLILLPSILLFAHSPLSQAQLFWGGGSGPIVGGTPPAGGAGTWDNSITNWATDSLGTAYQAWGGSGTAVFGATGDIVTIPNGTNLTVDVLRFDVDGYSLNSGTGTLDDAGGVLSFVGPTGATSTTNLNTEITGTGDWTFSYDSNNVPAQSTFVLGTANTRSGDLILQSPTNDRANSRTEVEFSNNNQLGPLTNSVVLNSKTILRATSDITLAHSINFSGGTFEITSGNTLTVNSDLFNGTADLDGGGQVVLNNALASNQNFGLRDVTLVVQNTDGLGTGGTVDFFGAPGGSVLQITVGEAPSTVSFRSITA